VKDARQQSAFSKPSILPHRLRRERAFSLHEALVTLVVISTASTVAVPAYQQLIASQRISSAVNSLVTALHLARSEAIKRNVRAVLCPSIDGRICRGSGTGDTAWENGYLVYIDRNANHEFDADDMVVWSSGAHEGLHIRSSANRDQVIYQPNGMAPGSNLTFMFCDKRGRGTPRAVIVSNTGRPRTSTLDASGSAIACPTAS
jgi:type IV fimbrial biogenesis protein FimT